jgi:hypothetical protein
MSRDIFSKDLENNYIFFSKTWKTIQEAGRLLPSHHPSQRTYQLSGVREMVGVDGGTDMSEDQEAEQSADLEVVIGKEEIVVGSRRSCYRCCGKGFQQYRVCM